MWGRSPVLVEKEDDRKPFVPNQSNAIVLYAAGKAPGRLLPENDHAKAIPERFFFVADVIAVNHAANHAAFPLRAPGTHEAQKILMD